MDKLKANQVIFYFSVKNKFHIFFQQQTAGMMLINQKYVIINGC